MIYKGTKKDDVYLGTAGVDTIEGFAGKDTLGGAGGNDRIAGGRGDDALDGGDGNDVLFSEDLGLAPTEFGWDTGPLDRLGYRDVLNGGAGDDAISAGTGDVIDGGAGIDQLALSLIREAAGLTLDLDALTAGGAVTLGSTTIRGIERLVSLQATAFADEIRYLAATHASKLTIDGGDGDDHVAIGSAKNEYSLGNVYGGGGDDVLEALRGFSGWLYGDDGDDRISDAYGAYGGAGNDVLVNNDHGYGGDGDDLISSVGRVAVWFYGEAGDDTLTADAGDDRVFGGGGADVVNGGAGDDELRSGDEGYLVYDNGAEVDRIDAGAGDDYVSIGYGDSAGGGTGTDTLHLSLAGATAGVVLDTTALYRGGVVHIAGGTISGFERFESLVATPWNDRITAFGGFVDGGDGDDRLTAVGPEGAGLSGGTGDDTIIANGAGGGFSGGDGVDTLDFSLLRARVTIEFDRGRGTVSTGAGFDGFESIVATGFADLIDLGDSDVSVRAGAGNDRLTVGSGLYRVMGEEGDDTIVLNFQSSSVSGAGLSGGAGSDRLIALGSADLSTATLDGTIEWIDATNTPGATLTIAVGQTRGVTRIDTAYLALANGGYADLHAVSLHASILYLADAGNRVLLGGASALTEIRGSNAADTVTSSTATSCKVECGGGNDIINFGAATAAVTLLGDLGDDRLIGGAGADTLDGGIGKDFLQGGAGNDRYLAVEAGDVVSEAANGGIDTVETWATYTLAYNVENLVLLGTAANGTGNGLANTISGNEWDNILNGKAGADVMSGGYGSDTYYVDNVGDQVIEGDWNSVDLVYASVNYTLPDWVEKLTMTAAGRTGTGNALANFIVGSTGADTLYGMDGNDIISSGGGADRMIGGNGDDTYHVDGPGDAIVEEVGGGADRVIASANYTISANVESLELIGDARVGQGNGGTNTITGSGGDDTLRGMGGIDVLAGGNGNDALWGGTGQDALFGDAGADVFAFAAGDSSADWTQADGIVDFSQGEHDRIDLSALGHLTFIGSGAFTGGAEVRFEDFDGDTLISIDLNGDRTAELVIGVLGPVSFTAADFILG